ncbi:MAG: tetratricopeptide repeat protein, partial [Anaeromyxobacteraceae bacterium]
RSAAAQAELALLCEQVRRPEEALTHHREAQRLAPDDARYRNNLAFALLVRGRPRDAIPLLEEALRSASNDPRLRNNLGFALAAAGDFTSAARQFDLAGPGAQSLNNLGYAYELAGNLPRAFELYLESVRLDPANARPRANLEHTARALDRAVPPDVVAAAETERGGS